MSAKPAPPTTAKPNPIDLSETDSATHVYVKVENPLGLSSKFEGPYKIISRPSRTQIQVRVGSFVNGLPRLLTYNWSSCKVAHMRSEAEEGSRPNLGRKRLLPEPPQNKLTDKEDLPAQPVVESKQPVETSSEEPAQIQTEVRQKRKTRNQAPKYT